ncbi:hypothetical protein N7501_001233 [Penicillium viridicatum]|nr:hypothetical protein N7501_001233 [Penicillium viridicatum]
MSGAEVLAVLGATSSVITICETCAAIVRFIQECQPTEATATLKPQVDLLADVITQLRSLRLDSPAHGLVGAAIAGLEKEVQNLQNLIEDFLKASSTPLLKRARKSFKIPIWEKKIQQNWTRIQQYQLNISFYLDFYNTKRLINVSRTETSLFLLPFQRPIHFVGRQDIFNQISQCINHSTQHPCMISLTGIGGIGKTEIARELCYRERPRYPVIVWFVADNERKFTQSVLNFANQLSTGQRTFNGYQDSLTYIQGVAKGRTEPWLFVFDNWELGYHNLDLFNFLVDRGQRDVIVTITRHPKPPRGIQIQIPPFSENDARQFLLGTSLSSSLEVEDAKILARQVGNLPLALAQMRAFMESEGHTIKEVLELWKENMNMVESTKPIKYAETIDSVLDISFEVIQREDSRLFDFLLQLSFIAVPVEFMFRDHFLVAQSRGESLPSFYQLFVHNKQWSSDLFLQAVMKLGSHALVRQELVGEVGIMVPSLHRLVKRVLQNQASKINLELQLMLQATAIIAAPLAAHDWEDLSLYPGSIFRESILECVEQRKSAIKNPDLIKRYSGISEGYQTSLAAFLAMYSNEEEQARNLLLQSLSLQSSWLGESASLTCTTMIWLTLLHLENMSLDKAEIMIGRLDSAESCASKPQESPSVDVQFLNGHLEMRKQNIDHAVSIFEHCTDLYAKISGISSVSTASALLSGVEAMLMQGNVEDATQSLYDAERIQKEIGSPRSLAIRVEWNLARHSLRMGDHIRAIGRYKDLCEEHENSQEPVGPLSRRWESLRRELGDVYLELGDIQKANAEYNTGRASASRRSRILKAGPGFISQWLIYGSLERTKLIPF